MTATRWYLRRNGHGDVMLTVERVSDRRRYTCFVESRAEARRELPTLRALVDGIDGIDAPTLVVRKTFGPVETG